MGTVEEIEILLCIVRSHNNAAIAVSRHHDGSTHQIRGRFLCVSSGLGISCSTDMIARVF